MVCWLVQRFWLIESVGKIIQNFTIVIGRFWLIKSLSLGGPNFWSRLTKNYYYWNCLESVYAPDPLPDLYLLRFFGISLCSRSTPWIVPTEIFWVSYAPDPLPELHLLGFWGVSSAKIIATTRTFRNKLSYYFTSTDPHHDISKQPCWHHPCCASVG